MTEPSPPSPSGSQTPAKPPRRWVKAGLIMAGVLLLLTAWRMAWFQPRENWSRASGWYRIGPGERTSLTTATMAELMPDFPMIHWLGHAGFLLESGRTRILLDPNVSNWVTLSRRTMTPPAPPSSWGDIDAVCISHAHFDHMDIPTLRQVQGTPTVFMPLGAERYLDGKLPETFMIEPVTLDHTVTVGDFRITPVPADHNGCRGHPFGCEIPAFGYILETGPWRIYFAGDTAMGNDWQGIRDSHRPQVAILPIGAFAPRFPLKIHHISPEEAVEAGRLLGVEWIIPCHFGTFNLSLDFPSTALPRFARAAKTHQAIWALPTFLESSP